MTFPSVAVRRVQFSIIAACYLGAALFGAGDWMIWQFASATAVAGVNLEYLVRSSNRVPRWTSFARFALAFCYVVLVALYLWAGLSEHTRHVGTEVLGFVAWALVGTLPALIAPRRPQVAVESIGPAIEAELIERGLM